MCYRLHFFAFCILFFECGKLKLLESYSLGRKRMKQNNSVWSETAVLPRFGTLKHDINVDVLIIGGGMAGILCAYQLQLAGIDYALVEAKRICSGITKNTTAKITCQHGLIFNKMLRRFGEEKTKLYLDANLSALAEYRKLCRKIDCDFENKDSYIYSLDDPRKIEAEVSALQKLGYPAKGTDLLPLPIAAAGAVQFPDQAQFHPLKFVSAIAGTLRVYEQTKVRELIGTTAVTESGRITAKKIIVATHFPLLNKHGSYYIKMYQERSYVIALSDAPDVFGMYADENSSGLSFRNYNDLLLLSGGSHRTGKKSEAWRKLEDFAAREYPRAQMQYRWAAQDCMTLDDIPYIGNYSARTPDLYVATGFNKWGMSSSMVAAMLLRDLVQGKDNPYAEVFSPSRSILRPQLAINSFEAVTNLLTPTKKRCPHLGCALKWNAAERTWDCPCHGSRFSENGRLIDNPSTDDLKAKQ